MSTQLRAYTNNYTLIKAEPVPSRMIRISYLLPGTAAHPAISINNARMWVNEQRKKEVSYPYGNY